MRKTRALTTVATVTAAIACFTATPAHAAAVLKDGGGRSSAASQHVYGFNVAAAKAHEASVKHLGVRTFGSPKALRSHASVPASYSLEQYAEEPGDQGQVGSCVTWATGYTGYGLLMNEQGISGDPMAPMYIYSQIAQGNDTGTWAAVALPMEQKQGIDTKDDYYQGDFDYWTQPTDAERENASHYKLSGFTDLTNSDDRRGDIEQAISSGLPVAIGFSVRESFEELDGNNYNYDPSANERVLGGHEVTIVGYDENGVTIENSWGGSWAHDGYFTAPWSWINSSDVDEVNSMGKLVQSS